MKASEALEIMGFSTGKNLTTEMVGKRFKQLIKENHPDHGGSKEMTVLIIAAREKLLEVITDDPDWFQETEATETNLPELLQEVLSKIRHLDGLFLEMRGTWLWVSGNTKPYKDILKENGFRWSANKKEWSWHIGGFRKRKGYKPMTKEQIRTKYGSEIIKTVHASRLGN